MANSETARKPTPAALDTPTDLERGDTQDVAGALNGVLADTYALYFKTKNFHWHASGPHFRDYHLLFDEQAAEILASTDELAERVRKVGGTTLRSVGHIGRLQRIKDNDADYVPPLEMLAELRQDNLACVQSMREAHKVADDADDYASASLLENFIDQAEKRAWFLFETARTEAGPHS